MSCDLSFIITCCVLLVQVGQEVILVRLYNWVGRHIYILTLHFGGQVRFRFLNQLSDCFFFLLKLRLDNMKEKKIFIFILC